MRRKGYSDGLNPLWCSTLIHKHKHVFYLFHTNEILSVRDLWRGGLKLGAGLSKIKGPYPGNVRLIGLIWLKQVKIKEGAPRLWFQEGKAKLSSVMRTMEKVTAVDLWVSALSPLSVKPCQTSSRLDINCFFSQATKIKKKKIQQLWISTIFHVY